MGLGMCISLEFLSCNFIIHHCNCNWHFLLFYFTYLYLNKICTLKSHIWYKCCIHVTDVGSKTLDIYIGFCYLLIYQFSYSPEVDSLRFGEINKARDTTASLSHILTFLKLVSTLCLSFFTIQLSRLIWS